MGTRRLYWIVQFTGWFSYLLSSILLTFLLGKPLTTPAVTALLSVFVLGLTLSHLYRWLILKLEWLRFGIARIVPRIILGSVLFGAVLELLYAGAIRLISGVNPLEKLNLVLQDFFSWTILFFLWSVIYFFYHFFKNYKAEEIKNLQWQARENELHLRRMRSQLNPHFIFNAMNSIRVLVDEDPKKAKKSITQLSNVLRSSLMMDKKRFIELGQEIDLVKDYLEIERARYEERLQVEWQVDEAHLKNSVPPMLIQTLVENAIKHGISRLPKGGNIRISTNGDEKFMNIQVENSGSLTGSKAEGTGYGLTSTRERLDILYNGLAEFKISERNNKVLAELHIPK